MDSRKDRGVFVISKRGIEFWNPSPRRYPPFSPVGGCLVDVVDGETIKGERERGEDTVSILGQALGRLDH